MGVDRYGYNSAFLQVPILINKKQWKELAAFAFFWLAAGIYASLILGTFIGDLAIPNVTEYLSSASYNLIM